MNSDENESLRKMMSDVDGMSDAMEKMLEGVIEQDLACKSALNELVAGVGALTVQIAQGNQRKQEMGAELSKKIRFVSERADHLKGEPDEE